MSRTATIVRDARTVAPTTSTTGIGKLVRFFLRRDRVLLPLWMLLTLGTLFGAAATAAQNYPTEQARQARLEQLQALPMFTLFQGKGFGASLEALAIQQAFGGTTLVAAIGAALLIVRNTRSEEQHGRRELLGSMAVGQTAPDAAPLSLTCAAGLVTGLIATVGLIGLGFAVAGSVLVGGVVSCASWMGAATAYFLCQVTSVARVAGASAVLVIMFFHYLRGIGHVAGADLLVWLSPSGWLEGTRAYAGDRPWPLLLVVGFVAVVIGSGLRIAARRDLGAGLVAARPGRVRAPRSLRGVAGLVWRQERTGFTIWASLIAMIGLVFGGAGAAAVRDYAQAQSAWLQDYSEAMGIADPAQTFFVYIAFVMVFPIAAYAILTVLRLRSEETGGTAEIVLSRPVPRLAWAAVQIVAALAGSAALLVILGGTLAISAPGIPGLWTLCLSLIPAVWVMVAITVLAFGVLPRWTTAIAWITLGIGIAGEILVKSGLPDIVLLATSPIAHVNPYYATSSSPWVLLAMAALLLTLGLAALRQRDLPR